MFKIKSKHSYVDFFEGILIGGSLAAMTTFLFGTKKGKEFQKELLHKYKQLEHKAEGMKGKIEKAINGPTSKKLKRAAKAMASHTVKTVRKVKSSGLKRKTARRSSKMAKNLS